MTDQPTDRPIGLNQVEGSVAWQLPCILVVGSVAKLIPGRHEGGFLFYAEVELKWFRFHSGRGGGGGPRSK